MNNSEAASLVRLISRCTIKPYLHISEKTPKQQPQQQQICQSTPWDISLISAQYIQFGLLFSKPPLSPALSSVGHDVGDQKVHPNTIIDQLKNSLSQTIAEFLPLTGRFVTNKHGNSPSYNISINHTNNSSGGVEFIQAVAPAVTLNHILSPLYVPPIVRSFFASYDEGEMTTINYDGHTIPLLTVQITELVDGYFIGCSINHSVVDGTSFWHFFQMWAETCSKNENDVRLLSRPPIIKRWFLKEHQNEVVDDDNDIANVPLSSHPDELIRRYPPPPDLVERIFHFSTKSMLQLKTRANNECGTNKNISAFQALSALVWRSLARARCLDEEQETSCAVCVDDRWRVMPPLSSDSFGCYIGLVTGKMKTKELLGHNLGSAALVLHKVIADHTDEKIRRWFSDWKKEPKIVHLGPDSERSTAVIGSSPRFDIYSCDFGWGKPLAMRTGWTYKFSGNVWANPGRDGKGSVELEICLSPKAMSALESDEEFMNAVSAHPV
ncbi:hypothetical protein C5167_034700 [Papaver somniferum]|uniref:Acetyltransferase n=1 Tax=Papaver somniferum TaxID=3469 RepID=A0A4Y7KHT1_PAPSO|nr:protein ENHANCED PSEUDOMONAS SUSCEPTIBILTY 1-like [Papaver somniferum]RZC71519.1 hypothetical protein C5167_034700 [Papaver somniferum]